MEKKHSPKVYLSFLVMKNLSQAWKNSRLKLSNSQSLCLVGQQIFLHSNCLQLTQWNSFQLSWGNHQPLKILRSHHKFNSNLRTQSSRCQRRSLRALLRKYSKGRSSTWRLSIMSLREMIAISALKRRGVKMTLRHTSSLLGVPWARFYSVQVS
jgi:hypothetical protein